FLSQLQAQLKGRFALIHQGACLVRRSLFRRQPTQPGGSETGFLLQGLEPPGRMCHARVSSTAARDGIRAGRTSRPHWLLYPSGADGPDVALHLCRSEVRFVEAQEELDPLLGGADPGVLLADARKDDLAG